MPSTRHLNRICVYAIENVLDGKVYVGATRNLKSRWNDHRKALNKGVHDAAALQVDWSANGRAAFRLVVLENLTDLADLPVREDHWIETLSAADPNYGYNTYLRGRRATPMKPAHREALAASNRRRGAALRLVSKRA